MQVARSNSIANTAAAAAGKPASILSKYHLIEKPVGEGTYGVVFKCRELDGNGFVVRRPRRRACTQAEPNPPPRRP